MSDDLNRQIFKEEAYDLLGELEGALLELEEAPDDMDTVNQVFRALHTIKGSGSMFGFEDIAEFTHEVESTFDKVRNGVLPVSPALCGLALRSRDYIKLLLGHEGEEEVEPEERQAILSGLQALASGEPVEPEQGHEEHAEESDDATAPEGQELQEPPTVDEAEPGGLAPAAPAVHDYRITLTPKGGAIVDEAGLESLFEELFKLGTFEVLSRPGDGLDSWDLSLVTDIASDNVRDVFFFADADLDVNIADLGGPAPVLTEQAGKGALSPEIRTTG
jgi:two-component system chemotaxis sensor kinase CheA